jgi:segregation and condensation protein A
MQKISEYVIDIENVFEGPLDLLMHLIRINEIDIHDIPISFILEEYLKYLRTLEKLDIDISSEFLLMVSVLLEIKSRMLLPSSYLDNMESDEEWLASLADPRRELVRALVFNDIHRRIEESLREREDIHLRIYPGGNRGMISEVSSDVSINLESIDLYDLLTAYQQILLREKPTSIQISLPTDSMDEVLRELMIMRKEGRKLSIFADAVGRRVYPLRVVLVFLAILELVKTGVLNIRQDSYKGEIQLEWM